MVLAWVIIILLITAPLWIWALYLLFLAKLEELDDKLSPEERKKRWERTLYGR